MLSLQASANPTRRIEGRRNTNYCALDVRWAVLRGSVLQLYPNSPSRVTPDIGASECFRKGLAGNAELAARAAVVVYYHRRSFGITRHGVKDGSLSSTERRIVRKVLNVHEGDCGIRLPFHVALEKSTAVNWYVSAGAVPELEAKFFSIAPKQGPLLQTAEVCCP